MPEKHNTEQWMSVVGYESLYEVSDIGQVRSVNRVDSSGKRRRQRTLNPTSNRRTGHMYVNLWRQNTGRMMAVHRAVLFAFVGPPAAGMEARHINGTPGDNRLSNLAWGSRSENLMDREIHGTGCHGERHYRTRLSVGDVVSLREAAINGEPYQAIAAQFGISRSAVSLIARGANWSRAPGPLSLRQAARDDAGHLVWHVEPIPRPEVTP